jgi:hypothetical protein
MWSESVRWEGARVGCVFPCPNIRLPRHKRMFPCNHTTEHSCCGQSIMKNLRVGKGIKNLFGSPNDQTIVHSSSSTHAETMYYPSVIFAIPAGRSHSTHL